jgi:UDP-3-O-acyl-N-acetylglucosamine deacetylase
MPWATCTSSASRCWRPTPRSARATLNNKLLRELLSHSDAYEVVTFDDEKRAPRGFGEVARAW